MVAPAVGTSALDTCRTSGDPGVAKPSALNTDVSTGPRAVVVAAGNTSIGPAFETCRVKEIAGTAVVEVVVVVEVSGGPRLLEELICSY